MANSSKKSETKCVECQPLKTLNDLMTWRYIHSEHPYRPRPLPNCMRKSPHAGEVILIHDMKGGYLDDRLVYGNDNMEAFRFFHWHLIDWFVYFAHHLVTIPPVGWIHVAHANGVPVLGTFITEWDDGQKILEEILSSEDNIRIVVDQLLLMCKHLRFDGWFVNIENVVKKDLIPRLIHFLKLLYDGGILVVWYDSVIPSGELKWQNEFNELNYPFAAALHNPEETKLRGRIFLNYTWKPEQLDQSLQFAQKHNFPAEAVHVGIDVFGRGCLGDGGMKCSIPLEEIRKRQPLSIGLFAPGWVYETQEMSDDKERFFHDLNRRTIEFWGLIEELLGGPRGFTETFRTDFSLAQGSRRFHHASLQTEPFSKNDLRRQSIMPHFFPSPNSSYRIEFDRQTAFSGSTCLKIVVQSLEPVEVPLFACWRGCEELEGIQVIIRWPRNGPGPEDRVCAIMLKVSNEDPEKNEASIENVQEKEEEGDDDSEDFCNGIIVVGMAECPEEIRKVIFDKIRTTCVDQERINQVCLMPSDGVVSNKYWDSSANETPELEPHWTLYRMQGFGTPSPLPPAHAMVYEVGILIWDLRNRPSAAAPLNRYMNEPSHPLWLNLGGLSIHWDNDVKQTELPKSSI